jgi:hypothetical protein
MMMMIMMMMMMKCDESLTFGERYVQSNPYVRRTTWGLISGLTWDLDLDQT